MNVPFVDLKAQHASILDETMEALHRVVKDASFILGRDVAEFEEAYAAYCDAKYAIGVDNGLSALKLALLAFGIGEGDEVIVPVNTFIATAAAVTFTGAKPVFVDCNALTYNIDVEQIEAAITPQTRAIIAVHLYGTPADMDPILDIASKHNLVVIEDAAQAHGAYYKGRRIGSLGHAAAFSFYPAKNLGALGDGGIVVTSDHAAAERIRGMRNVGQVEKNIHSLSPNNHRLDTVHAAVLKIKLRHIDTWNAARRQYARLYDSLLAGFDVVRPAILQDMEQVWHLYVVRTENRDTFRACLEEQGISTGIHYPIPLHLQPYYESLGYQKGDFPVAERQAEQIVSLPMFAEMTEEMVEAVVKGIEVFQTSKRLPTA